MAKPNISLLGATYSGVAGVTLPTSGGGTATFPWVEGSETKTANGTYDVTNLAQLIVNVAGGGGSGLVYESGTYTPSSNIARPTISFTNTHTTPPFYAMIYDATGTTYTTGYSNKMFEITATYYIDSGSSSALAYYGRTSYLYRSSNSNSGGGTNLSSTSDSGNSGVGYYVGNTYFKPYTSSDTRYWRAGRTYKWIAVWGPTT